MVDLNPDLSFFRIVGLRGKLLLINPLKSSGHYMYHQFNVQQFYVLPTQTVFMCFVWIWEQTAIISLYSITWLELGVVYEVGKTSYVETTSVRPSVCVCVTKHQRLNRWPDSHDIR